MLACVFGLLTTERVAAAPVTWDFQATSCSNLLGPGCVAAQQYPALLATLTLPGPDSAGSAFWAGDPLTAPVYTGDSFVLDFSAPYRPLSPAFAGNGGPPDGCNPKQICDFNLSWTETAGQLTALSIFVEGFNDEFGSLTFLGEVFGLHGGAVGSDDTYFGVTGGTFAGCVLFECLISGFWTNATTVAEPGTLALLAGALAAFGLARRRKVSGGPMRWVWLASVRSGTASSRAIRVAKNARAAEETPA